MNVNVTVITALSSLSLPVHANAYNGTADEYITFNYADERPVVSRRHRHPRRNDNTSTLFHAEQSADK